MSNRRLVQHRQQRDTSTQEVAELKKEVRTLKRQLARSNRERDRLQGIVEGGGEAEESAPVKEEGPSCPGCGSVDLTAISTPAGKTITICRSCKWKSKAV